MPSCIGRLSQYKMEYDRMFFNIYVVYKEKIK